jgi:hypothetical protein
MIKVLLLLIKVQDWCVGALKTGKNQVLFQATRQYAVSSHSSLLDALFGQETGLV